MRSKKHSLGDELTERCRKCDTVDETTEHVTVGCLSLSASTHLRRHNQLATIIHQPTVTEYKLLDINTLPYCRYKSEPVLESANTVLCWDRSIVSDKTVDFNRPDIMFIERETKKALVTDIAVTFLIQRQRKLQNMKIWCWKSKISGNLTRYIYIHRMIKKSLCFNK
jgi:hypothetical protein